MAHFPPPGPAADRNLLFGVLALQVNFIGRDSLVAAMQAWVADKDKPLGQILQEQGALDEAERAVLEPLVDRHLRRHGDDPRRSLAAAPATSAVCDALSALDDPEVRATVSLAATACNGMPETVAEARREGGSRYQVLRPHARGGLGEVFVALDHELHREVALKEMQAKYGDDPFSRGRFVQEAEITGGLEHPGIVPVYGLGRYADGRPYYAMRLIRGQNLQEAIDRFHAEDGPGRAPGERRLALRQLLGRFLALCNTVAYAHSRGVIHRDLKPANVMLGPYGETLVVDWGVAKAVGRGDGPADTGERTLRPGSADGREATQAGQVVGTPAFMSPEQAEGRPDEVGPASDLYSLGATLFTLLTGELPVRGRNTGEILDRVRRGEAGFAHRAPGTAPPALAAVCRKAMALRAGNRYATALDLAADVEHWLADEPVSAYPEPLAARCGRWVRRHRTAVTGAVAAVAVAAVCLGAATVLLTAARAGEHRAKVLAEQQRDRARDHFELARHAVDRFYTRVSESPELKAHGLEKLRTSLLETAAEFYERFVQEEEAGPKVQVGRAFAYRRLGMLYQDTGRHRQADDAFRQSLAIWKQLADEHADDLGAQAEVAVTYHRLGWLCQNSGRGDEAEEAHRQAVTILERVIEQRPGEAYYQNQLAWTYNDLGLLYEHTSRMARAREVHEKALALRERLVRADPDNDKYLASLEASHTNLGGLYLYAGRSALAEKEYQQARDLSKRLAEKHPDSPEHQSDLAGTHYNLGFYYDRAGQAAKAESAFKEALLVEERLAAEHPTVLKYQERAATTQNMLGGLYRQRKRFAEAGALYEKSLAIREKLFQAHPEASDVAVELGGTYCNRGFFLVDLHDYKAATESFHRAAQILEGVLGKNERDYSARRYLLNVRRGLASVCMARGLKDEAEAAYRKIAETQERLARDNPDASEDVVQLGGCLCNLANRLRENNKPEAAVASYTRAVETLEGLLRKDPKNGLARLFLCNSLEGRGFTLGKFLSRHADAFQDLERASRLATDQNRDWLRVVRACLLARSGDYRQAVAEAQELSAKKDPDDWLLDDAAHAHALAASAVQKDARLAAAERDRLADEYAARALTLLALAAGKGYYKTPAAVGNLKSDPDFEALRSRPEFKEFVADAEKRLNVGD
jgi:serine/threonine-protein kinase